MIKFEALLEKQYLFLYFPTSVLLYLTVSWKLPAPEAELDVDDEGLQGDAGLVWDLA